MTNSDVIEQAQKEAQSKIESGWQDVATKYTVAWGGPLEAVEMMFPHISDAISDNQVSSAWRVAAHNLSNTRESTAEHERCRALRLRQ